MTVTITLTDDIIVEQLRATAARQHISIEETALRVLRSALRFGAQDELTPEEVVAKIQATPPNSKQIRPATGSLAEALQNGPDDPEFDLNTWQQQWAGVEREMKAITRANDVAEGRRTLP